MRRGEGERHHLGAPGADTVNNNMRLLATIHDGVVREIIGHSRDFELVPEAETAPTPASPAPGDGIL